MKRKWSMISGSPGKQTAPFQDRRPLDQRPIPSMPKTHIQREPWPVFQARMRGETRD